jgi:hypothetical protein
MDLPESLNPVARRVATQLFSVRPEFQARLNVLDGCNFEASVPAPEGSHAGALVVCTAHDGDIWVHFAPPQMWYSVDDEQELIAIVDQLLRDEVLFVRTTDANGAWAGTTLARRLEDVELNQGETATLLSWSGSQDQTAG